MHITRLRPDLTPIAEPMEITDQVKGPAGGGTPPGPGTASDCRRAGWSSPRTTRGSRRRLVEPPYGAHGLISDDDGFTWRIYWIADGIDGASEPTNRPSPADPSDPTEALVTLRNENRDEPGPGPSPAPTTAASASVATSC